MSRAARLLVGCLILVAWSGVAPLRDVGGGAEAHELVVVWRSPPVRFRQNDDASFRILAGSYPHAHDPGAPAYPYTTTLLALPHGVTPRLDVTVVAERRLALPGPLEIAPSPRGVLRDARGVPIGGAFAHALPRASASRRSPVVLEDVGIVRGVRLARLVYVPVRQQGGHLRWAHHVEVRVRWETALPDPPPKLDAVQTLVRRQVLNPQHAIPQPARQPALTQTTSITPSAMLSVLERGVYQLTSADVQALDLLPIDPHTLRLFQGQQEIAAEWQGDADAVFEAGEALVFYVEPRFSRWLRGDVIRLVVNGGAGLRMPSRSAAPAGLPPGRPWVEDMLEENRLYTPDRFLGDDVPPGRDGEPWVWDDLNRAWGGTGHISETYTFDLPHVDVTRAATLTAWLIGYTDLAARPDHHVGIAVNGVSLGQVQWDGRRAALIQRTIPGSVLLQGDNVLTLRLVETPGLTLDGVWLDSFAVRHRYAALTPANALHFTGQDAPRAYTLLLSDAASVRAYDVSRPFAPLKLVDVPVAGNRVTLGDAHAGGVPSRYVVVDAGGVLRPAHVRPVEEVWRLDAKPHRGAGPHPHKGAEMLVITPPALAQAVEPLCQWRESQGTSCGLVNVLGLYDRWGDGRPDPEAIRAFLADAYATGNPRPTYVLLVGDGSFDPKGYQHPALPHPLPPYLANVDPWAGETAADNRYACVDGGDALPDLLLGRLPGKSAAEIQAMVAKIIAYERQTALGGWNRDVVLVSDDSDAAGDFAASSATTARAVVPPFAAVRYDCAGVDPLVSDCPTQETRGLHRDLLGRWERGALAVQFFGHASWQQWAAERFLHLDDLPGLGDHQRLPVVLGMTCFTGAFHRPEPTLDESLVSTGVGGAVAAWGATGLGVDAGHQALSAGFFRAALDDGVATVGQATLQGKLTLAAQPYHQELLDTFVLLGDPALALDRAILPWPHAVFLPVVIRGAGP